MAFEGKSLADAEEICHSSQQEVLAVVHALQVWQKSCHDLNSHGNINLAD